MKKIEPVTLVLILEAGVPATRRSRIRARLEELGVRVRHVDGGEHSYLEIMGDDLPVRTLSPENWEGVAGIVPLTPAYPHASWGAGRGTLVTPTSVTAGGVAIGAGSFVMIAGPCAIESAESAHRIASAVAAAGAEIFRGGAYKPRTSPYAFQGLEEEGLRILAEVRERSGLPVVTEVIDTRLIERVAQCADILQVGSRNMQNYAL
ncbi:MAG: 3-deoxy-7-phosphoheptulonate synthase, partial [Planctomycetes bacterium]|nr:3-deoxy-7-phosphoheptulonate synthase [Planctomycetota bacterium]